jgi:hypothetical protein
MRAKTSDGWQARVLKAREHFLDGLLKPGRPYKITKADLMRSRERLMQQVKHLTKRIFT